jgi:hypothetical protein
VHDPVGVDRDGDRDVLRREGDADAVGLQRGDRAGDDADGAGAAEAEDAGRRDHDDLHRFSSRR